MGCLSVLETEWIHFQPRMLALDFQAITLAFLDSWCCFSMVHSSLLCPTFAYSVPLLLLICNWFYYTVRGSWHRHCPSLRKHSPRVLSIVEATNDKEVFWRKTEFNLIYEMERSSPYKHRVYNCICLSTSNLPRTRTFCFKNTQPLW